MTAPRLVFVNRFAWPEQPATAQLLTELSEALAAAGESVVVYARRPASALLRQARNGVDLVRIPGTSFGHRGLVGRALDYAVFLRHLRRQLAAELRPGDILVSMTDPPLLSSALDPLVRARGARHVHWIQDIFPEVASATLGTRLPQLLARRRDRAWLQADACIVPGADMADFVRSRGVRPDRVLVSENWAPADLAETDASAWRKHHGLSGNYIVMYSGNLGRVHDFSAIVPVAAQLVSDTRVAFVFVGGGARRAALEGAVRARGLPNVKFIPAQPLSRLAETLSAGDLHLVTLRDGCERFVFPSKLYGIAAVGRRAVVIGPRQNEPGRIVSWFGFGASFEPNETDRIAAHLREAASNEEARARLGRAAREFSRQRGRLTHALTTWQRLLAWLKPLAEQPPESADSEAPS